MKKLKHLIVIFTVLSIFSTACHHNNEEVTPTQNTELADTKQDLDAVEKKITPVKGNELDPGKMLRLINAKRKSGCDCGDEFMPAVPRLRWNKKLETAAYKHSEDMNNNNYFDHKSQDGSSAGDRIQRTGYQFWTWGENIASGQRSEEQVMEGWIKSAGHCRNIMNANFTQVGAGRSGNLWTQVFAAPRTR